VKDQSPTTKIGHTSTDGITSFMDRVKSLEANCRTIGENIYYGSGSPRDGIIKLAVDDGRSSR